MKTRTRLELLKLLRKGVDKYLEDNPCTPSTKGICYVALGLKVRGKVSHREFYFIEGILNLNWHLAKYPTGVYKFDTKQERLDFLDMLIKKCNGVREE